MREPDVLGEATDLVIVLTIEADVRHSGEVVRQGDSVVEPAKAVVNPGHIR